MRPMSWDQHETRSFGPPRGWDEQENGPCGVLSIHDVRDSAGANRMVSIWQPTPEELARLQSGAPVMLTIFGDVHPPVSVGVGEPGPSEENIDD